MPARVVQVLLDGLGDRSWPQLDGLTPLEAAATPNLDALARAGTTGLLHPLGRGLAPSSELGHWALFGYPPALFPGRAYFEALAAGVPLEPDDVVLWATFAHVEPQPDGTLLAVRREVPLSAEEFDQLTAALPVVEGADVTAGLVTVGRRCFLRVRGGGSADVTDSFPFREGEAVVRVLPLEDAPDSAGALATASVVESFLAGAHAALRTHPVNASRIVMGDPPADFVLTKWAGQDTGAPSFTEHTGFAAVMAASGSLYEGIAKRLGMRWIGVPDESDPVAALSTRIEAALSALEDGCDFVHVHTKAPDEAGHTKDPARKRDVLAALDGALAPLTPTQLPADTLVVVTGDHATPSGTNLLHSGDPVPLLIAGPGVTPDDVVAFGERQCAQGGLGHLGGIELMPTLLDIAGRGRFMGSRLVPEPTLFQPETPEPFRLP